MKPDSTVSRYLTPSSYVDRTCYLWQFALCALAGAIIGAAFAKFF